MIRMHKIKGLDKCWWEPLIEVYCVFEPLENATIELEKNLIILTRKKPSKSQVRKNAQQINMGPLKIVLQKN